MSSWRQYSSPMHSGGHPQGMPTQPSPTALPQAATSTEMNGPRAKCDQVVFEAIAKAAEIVVGSRCWIDPSPLSGNANVNNNNTSSSSRFNLLVPEVQGVRSILQRWKRALHVPLRLDVYYQHADSRRELLERWCLEYAPKPYHQTHADNTDPIVQLRQVCKQIVIWLRTLYCWSRMLPAQALRMPRGNNANSIGFSIYVVSEGNDDVSGLVSSQGFSSEGQPHSVWTPYGELGWKVFYAPQAMVQRLIPEASPYPESNRTPSQPIPMNQQPSQTTSPQTKQYPASLARDALRRESTPPSYAKSAPQGNTGRLFHRSYSDVSAEASTYHAMTAAAAEATANKGSFSRSNSKPMPNSPQQPMQPATIEPPHPLAASDDEIGPTKNLSALSLAMMSDAKNKAKTSNTTAESPIEKEAAEKRRAALHHAPPQLASPLHRNPTPSPVPPKPLASAGEYGYGYNNHIPPIRLPAAEGGAVNTTVTYRLGAMDGMTNMSPSSTPLASTPPGYLLSVQPPPAAVEPSSYLIPPRGSAGALTPPFTRPMGFVAPGSAGEQPAALSSQAFPPAAIPASTPPGAVGSLRDGPANTPVAAAPPPPTSLDMLHSSPFQQNPYGSVFGGPGFSSANNEALSSFALSSGIAGNSMEPPTSWMNPRLQEGVLTRGHHSNAQDPDDMPFAVDSFRGPTESGSHGDGQGTSMVAASNGAMESFASSAMIRDMMNQQPKRLQLFDSVAAGSTTTTASNGPPATNGSDSVSNQPNGDNALSALADQLAEFKTFGASLHVVAATAGQPTSSPLTSAKEADDVSTPISLRS